MKISFVLNDIVLTKFMSNQSYQSFTNACAHFVLNYCLTSAQTGSAGMFVLREITMKWSREILISLNWRYFYSLLKVYSSLQFSSVQSSVSLEAYWWKVYKFNQTRHQKPSSVHHQAAPRREIRSVKGIEIQNVSNNRPTKRTKPGARVEQIWLRILTQSRDWAQRVSSREGRYAF